MNLFCFQVTFFYYTIYVYDLFVYVYGVLYICVYLYVHHILTWYQRNSEDIGFPVSSIKDSYEPPCGCSEPNPDPLQE